MAPWASQGSQVSLATLIPSGTTATADVSLPPATTAIQITVGAGATNVSVLGAMSGVSYYNGAPPATGSIVALMNYAVDSTVLITVSGSASNSFVTTAPVGFATAALIAGSVPGGNEMLTPVIATGNGSDSANTEVIVTAAATRTLPLQPASGSVVAYQFYGATGQLEVIPSGTDTLQFANVNAQTAFYCGPGMWVVFQYVAGTWYAVNLPNPLLLSKTLYSGAGAGPTLAIPAGWNNCRIEALCRSSDASGANDAWTIRINGDTGPHYDGLTIYGNGESQNGAGSVADAADNYGIVYLANAAATAAVPGFIEIAIPNYAGTTFEKFVKCSGGYLDYATTIDDAREDLLLLLWRSTAAVTSVEISPQTGPDFAIGSQILCWLEL